MKIQKPRQCYTSTTDKNVSFGFPGGGAPTPPQGSFWDMTPEQQGMYSANLIMGTMQSCPGKSVMAGVTGFGLGGVFGLFMASVSINVWG